MIAILAAMSLAEAKTYVMCCEGSDCLPAGLKGDKRSDSHQLGFLQNLDSNDISKLAPHIEGVGPQFDSVEGCSQGSRGLWFPNYGYPPTDFEIASLSSQEPAAMMLKEPAPKYSGCFYTPGNTPHRYDIPQYNRITTYEELVKEYGHRWEIRKNHAMVWMRPKHAHLTCYDVDIYDKPRVTTTTTRATTTRATRDFVKVFGYHYTLAPKGASCDEVCAAHHAECDQRGLNKVNHVRNCATVTHKLGLRSDKRFANQGTRSGCTWLAHDRHGKSTTLVLYQPHKQPLCKERTRDYNIQRVCSCIQLF